MLARPFDFGNLEDGARLVDLLALSAMCARRSRFYEATSTVAGRNHGSHSSSRYRPSSSSMKALGLVQPEDQNMHPDYPSFAGERRPASAGPSWSIWLA
jgi:hypothetical protein